MNSALVDFHCHLDLYPSLESAVREAEEASVYTLAVTTTPYAWPRNFEISRLTRHVRAALGLHPQLVAERHAEIGLWEGYLPQTRYVGEVGLDASPRYYGSLDLQTQIFQRVLEQCAMARGKVLSVHSVRAATAVLDLVEKYLPPPQGQIVLHWFTGSKAEARRAVDLGCYFSVNAAMTSTQRGRELAASLPTGRLLTETDGPFTQTENRPARPIDVGSVVGALAELHSVAFETMASEIRANLRVLLNSAEGIAEEPL